MSVLKWEAPNTWSAEAILSLIPITTTSISESVPPSVSLQLISGTALEVAPRTTGTLVGNNATVHLYAGTSPVIPTEDTRPTPTLIAMAIITLN